MTSVAIYATRLSDNNSLVMQFVNLSELFLSYSIEVFFFKSALNLVRFLCNS